MLTRKRAPTWAHPCGPCGTHRTKYTKLPFRPPAIWLAKRPRSKGEASETQNYVRFNLGYRGFPRANFQEIDTRRYRPPWIEYHRARQGLRILLVPFSDWGEVLVERKAQKYLCPFWTQLIGRKRISTFLQDYRTTQKKKYYGQCLGKLRQLPDNLIKKFPYFLAQFPLKFDLIFSCSAEEQWQGDCRSPWASTALVGRLSMSPVIRPNNIT